MYRYSCNFNGKCNFVISCPYVTLKISRVCVFNFHFWRYIPHKCAALQYLFVLGAWHFCWPLPCVGDILARSCDSISHLNSWEQTICNTNNKTEWYDIHWTNKKANNCFHQIDRNIRVIAIYPLIQWAEKEIFCSSHLPVVYCICMGQLCHNIRRIQNINKSESWLMTES